MTDLITRHGDRLLLSLPPTVVKTLHKVTTKDTGPIVPGSFFATDGAWDLKHMCISVSQIDSDYIVAMLQVCGRIYADGRYLPPMLPTRPKEVVFTRDNQIDWEAQGHNYVHVRPAETT